jgi:putative transposase
MKRKNWGDRRTHRLPKFDYTLAGAYFLTIKTHNNAPIFGRIKYSIMHLNDMGRIVDQVWNDIPSRFPWVDIDEFQIMPDHIHGIVWIKNSTKSATERTHTMDNLPCRGESHSPLDTHTFDNSRSTRINLGKTDTHKNQQGEWDDSIACGNFIQRTPIQRTRPNGTSKTLGSVVRGFKIPVTQWARQNAGIPVVWQRDYFDRIIRSQQSVERIRRYIVNNPVKWQRDHDRGRFL